VLTSPPYQAVVMGGSAGGFAALGRILPALPAGYPLPLLVVLHLHRLHEGDLLRGLAHRCRLLLKEAEPGEAVAGGTAYFAPPNYHLLVEPSGRLALSIDERVNWSRPSIDVTFESAAAVWGAGLVGVILTGANQDGARGLQAVRARGGLAIVQDPASAEVPFMPLAAVAAGPVDHLVPLEDIPTLLLAAAGLAGSLLRGETT
jgi:two-component system chemotaxis response regulator CheB